MRKSIVSQVAILGMLLLPPQAAKADSACWAPEELHAYDITMHTLLLAHVTAACADRGQPGLRSDLAGFLAQHAGELNADRDALGHYYQRAYGEDWQAPLNQSLERENQRVGQKATVAASTEFCAGAAPAIQALSSGGWNNYVAAATGENWHDKAGLPGCN